MARPSKSDPQQYQVYALERNIQGPGGATLSRKAVRALCDLVCETYGVEKVRLQFKDLKGWAACCYPDGRIVIGRKRTSQSVLTVLHELAHHLHNELAPGNTGRRDHQAHGPEFMACAMHLYDRSRVIPFVAMKALCRDLGVKFRDPGKSGTVAALKRALR